MDKVDNVSVKVIRVHQICHPQITKEKGMEHFVEGWQAGEMEVFLEVGGFDVD